MKKLIAIVVLLGVAGAAWFLSSGRQSTTVASSGSANGVAATTDGGVAGQSDTTTGSANDGGSEVAQSGPNAELFDSSGDTRPAVEMYKTFDAALAAVKKGAGEYDDIILEQFTTPGEDCSWCAELYASIKGMIADPATPQDQRSYFAELLAVSGRVENLQTLVDGIKNAANSDAADVYAEALELAMGKDDVATFLGSNMSSDNETLREASIAAVTNQGSRLAAELLYKNTAEKGDPDGYYQLGIGLGELVPEEEAMPYLQELVLKRDPYSHLALKSLLNGGQQGLQVVMDVLNTSPNADGDRAMLKDAIDHVSFDEETEAYVRKVADSSINPVVLEFAKRILEDFEANKQEESEEVPADEPTPLQSIP